MMLDWGRRNFIFATKNDSFSTKELVIGFE
jgi:hypothetical protein